MMRENQHGKREDHTAEGQGALAGLRLWWAGLDRKQRIRCRVLLGVIVVLLAGLLALRWWIRVPDLPDEPVIDQPSSSEGPGGQATAHGGRREGVYTFLVVGRDVISGSTDTMLLLTYDTKAKTIQGLNLPRDTMVNVSTASKRLNAVYNYNRGKDKATQVENGMAALKDQVAKLTGIRPDFYVVVEWEAIGKLVDAIGGVEFEVPFDMDYDDPYQDLHIHQKAGLRLLNGDDAMQVIRHRKNNDGSHSRGDVGRLVIQQDFLKAAAKKCLQPATFLKLPALVEIFAENVKTDLSVGNILAFAELAKGMEPETGVSFSTAPLGDSFSYKGAALVTLDETELLKVINSGLNPYEKEITAADLELVVHLKSGGFTVTNGTLADPKMAGSGGSKTDSSSGKTDSGTKPDETKPPEQTEQPEQPGQTGDTSQPEEQPGDTSSGDGNGEEPGGDSSQPGDSSSGGDSGSGGESGGLPDPIDPGEIFPEPPPSQDLPAA